MGTLASRRPKEKPGPTFMVRDKLYRYLGVIGQGGEATVYLCEDQTARRYAAKVFDFSRYPSTKQTQKIRNFLKQARIMRYLGQKSPHFIRLYNYSYNPFENLGYMIMELSDGSLRDYLRGKPFGKSQCRETWQQIVVMLKELENANVVHADIKPENILVINGALKLTDLGLAFHLSSTEDVALREGVRGTLDYMAPEVFFHRTGYASDVWSAGIILYEMVYGRPPFSHLVDRRAKVEGIKHAVRIPMPPTEDRWLNDCLRHCLQYRMEYRANADDLLEHPYFQA